MNYLKAFLDEETRAGKPIPPTDKTAKTPETPKLLTARTDETCATTSSVSFGSDPLARTGTCFSPGAAEAPHYARLDAERNERDHRINRGYDYALPQRGAATVTTPQRDAFRNHVETCAQSMGQLDSRHLDPAGCIYCAVQEIEDRAKACGWTHGELWHINFWPQGERGLLALLDPGDRVVLVTHDYLTIEKNDGRGTLLRFMKHQA